MAGRGRARSLDHAAQEWRTGFSRLHLLERVALAAGPWMQGVIDQVLREVTSLQGVQQLFARGGGPDFEKGPTRICRALLSGGFTRSPAHVAQVLGFGRNRAIKPAGGRWQADRDVARPILGRQAKIEALNMISGAGWVLAESEVIARG